MRRIAVLAGLAWLLAGCAIDIKVDPQGEGKYTLTIDTDYNARLQGPERLLGKKAEELCPDGYDRLKRKSIHERHGGITDKVAWEIQCS